MRNCQIQGAINVLNSNFQPELNNVTRSCHSNGFREPNIYRQYKTSLTSLSEIIDVFVPKSENNDGLKSVVFLPYINVVTNQFLQKHPKYFRFYLHTRINWVSCCRKVSCFCGRVFTCETGRSEHQCCLRTDLLDRSAVSDNHHNTGHEILLDNSSISAILSIVKFVLVFRVTINVHFCVIV